MRAAMLMLSAGLLLPPALSAGPVIAESGEVLALFARDARSEHLFIERRGDAAQWAEVRRDGGGSIMVRVPDGMAVRAGDRVTLGRDAASLREPDPARIAVPPQVVAAVTHGAAALPGASPQRLVIRGDRIFIERGGPGGFEAVAARGDGDPLR